MAGATFKPQAWSEHLGSWPDRVALIRTLRRALIASPGQQLAAADRGAQQSGDARTSSRDKGTTSRNQAVPDLQQPWKRQITTWAARTPVWAQWRTTAFWSEARPPASPLNEQLRSRRWIFACTASSPACSPCTCRVTGCPCRRAPPRAALGRSPSRLRGARPTHGCAGRCPRMRRPLRRPRLRRQSCGARCPVARGRLRASTVLVATVAAAAATAAVPLLPCPQLLRPAIYVSLCLLIVKEAPRPLQTQMHRQAAPAGTSLRRRQLQPPPGPSAAASLAAPVRTWSQVRQGAGAPPARRTAARAPAQQQMQPLVGAPAPVPHQPWVRPG